MVYRALYVFVLALLLSAAGCTSNAATNEAAAKTPATQVNVQEDGAVKLNTLGGTISILKLPPHRGLIVSLAFFEVDGPDAKPPYDGDPPADAVMDCPELYNNVDLDSESFDTLRDIPFSIKHSSGYFYIQLRIVLFRKHEGRVFAQAEQFFFRRRPLPLLDDLPSVALPVEWPAVPIEELQHYGTVTPKASR